MTDKPISKPLESEKKNKRKDHKYPALVPDLNLKTRYDEISDIASYVHLLNDEEKAWMHSFVSEEICANLNHKGVKLNNPEDPETRRRIYLANNARNRDVYSRETAQGKMNYLAEIEEQNEKEGDMESGIYEPEF